MRAAIFIALTAAAVRLIPLQWLHPLNWDEIEFYRATAWIGDGLVPYRDFWEHHTPLAWFLFAPFTKLLDAAGAGAILAMRWAQIPVWIATFWLVNVWMRGTGIARDARWAAMAFALCSSLLMLPAIEYRVESVGCLLFVLGLVLASPVYPARRRGISGSTSSDEAMSSAGAPGDPASTRGINWRNARDLLAGIVFCLAGFANLRLGPVLVVTVLLHLRPRIIAGGVMALAACLAYFAATGSADELWQQVWRDNLAEKFATPIPGGFLHRLLVTFGVRLLASDRLFDWAAVDVGGMVILLFGFVALLLGWRRKELRPILILQIVNLLFIASMKFIYNYHFALVVILAIPLVASVVERIPRRGLVTALLVLAWSVNAFASIFRGKELDLAYQTAVMAEVDSRTKAGEKVWSGVAWALRREPAYRFWFLPELTRHLVLQGLAPRYSLEDDPPAAVVFDHYALLWVATVQRELAPYLVRHYMPAWRNLWIPAMNAVVQPGQRVEWIVPRDGTYHLFASPELARHRWFRDPFHAYRGDELRLRGMQRPPLVFSAGPHLRKGQRVSVISHASEPLGVILLSSNDTVLFRQPPSGATLEAESTRVTHVPHFPWMER
ncbi:MAG TPA: hypothetical protein VGQ36_12090 [Thermoanaerobaculia bacterium]|nr:hypothetical protein [Thermoanaerobaculia bacterium]